MKKRSESYFGLHFDFHASPSPTRPPLGRDLKEEDIRDICRTLHPDFLQIDCKGHPGWASYPTECGNAMPDFACDTLAMWRKVTQEEGVALYMHYSGVIDKNYCSKYPDDAILLADGSRSDSVTRTLGRYADKLLIPQLKELAGRYQVDGVWVDGECWGDALDYDPRTLAAFKSETGIDLTGCAPTKPEDPYWVEFREFNRELFRRYVNYYVDEVHKVYPGFQIASNWAFTDHMPEKISANVDFVSGDLNPWDSLNAARYAGRAIAQQNFTWDLMAWNFRSSMAGLITVPKHPIQILQEAAAVISLGGGFQNYITQFPDGSPRMDQILKMKALSDFMRPREAFCFRGKQVHQVGIVMSTFDRLRESASLYTRNGYEKIVGLTALTLDAGHACEIISEHTFLGHESDYPVIAVPETFEGLEENTVKSLLAYAENGGSLLLIGEKTCRLFEKAGASFTLGEKQEKNAFFTLDHEYFGQVSDYASVIGNGRRIAAVTADARHEGITIAGVYPYGKGKIAACGFDLGKAYNDCSQYLHKHLIKALYRELYSPIAEITACEGILEQIPLMKDGRLYLQLLNANGNHKAPNCATEDQLVSCRDITVTIASDKMPTAIMLQPADQPIPFTYECGKVTFRLDKVALHEIIEIIY